MEIRFVCNVTVKVDLIQVEGARARSDRTGLGSLLSAWPGAFYLRVQGPSICMARGLLSAWPGAFYLRVQGPFICVARGLLSAWLGALYLRVQGSSICLVYLREDQGGHRGGEAGEVWEN